MSYFGKGTCLVTGSNGFLGSAIVRALLAQGYAVRSLVRQSSDQTNLRALQTEILYGDVTDKNSLIAAMRDCSYVFHAAADYRLWTRNPKSMYRTNVDGSVNVIEAARVSGIKRVIYTSSVAVLGINRDRSPANETTPVNESDMIGHYKRSKYLAEVAVRGHATSAGVQVVTVNPSTPIGPGDIKPTPTGRIIVDAANGKMPAYVDTGLNIVHVDDVAAGHLLALEFGKAGERYILGGQDLSLKQILEIVAHQLGKSPPRVRLPRGAVYPIALISELLATFTGREPRATLDGLRMAAKHMYFSSEKAKADLRYTARPAALAIEDALSWFRDHSYI